MSLVNLLKFNEKLKITVKNEKLKIFKQTYKKFIKNRFIIKNIVEFPKKKIKLFNFLSNNKFSLNFNLKFNLYILISVLDKQVTRNFFNFNFNKIFKFNSNQVYFILIYKNYILYFYYNIYFDKNNKDIFYQNIYYNKSLSSINFFNIFFTNINDSLFLLIYSWFDKICKNIYNFSFLKFKYKGKNYRWHRKKKGLVLRFGHSHLIYSKKPSTVFLKKKGRMKIIFFGTNVILIRLFLKNLIFWKPSNVYTGRGLRISRQRLLRKSGKVSAYR